jgi:membrane peptidoglycan carboxypeptidase
MSAQKSRGPGAIGSAIGFLGFSVLAGILVTVMVTPALAVTSMTANNSIGLFDSLPDYVAIGDQPQQNEIIAYNAGVPEVIARVYSQNRVEVKWDEVSQFVKDAAVAGEDVRFYEHGGVDIQGVIRAAIKNSVSGGISSGASTLSMQLVKNLAITQALQAPTIKEQKKGVLAAQKESFDRKLKEMKLAIGLEKRYTKNQILLAYLNIAGFGGNTYGIESAAQRYYGVSAKDLSLSQAASLMAIVQQPTARSLDKVTSYKANQERRDVILKNMFVAKMISKKQLDDALAITVNEKTVKLTPPINGCIAADPYAMQFCDYIVNSVKDLDALGSSPAERAANWKIGGYKIYTTLDLALQHVAQDSVRQYAPNTETRFQFGSSSTTVQVGTGRILTMAQNKVFDNSLAGGGPTTSAINFNTDFDYGGSGGFQVGSTYKIFTLLNWLEQGHGLNEVVNALPRTENQALFVDSCDGIPGDHPYGGPYKFKNDTPETGTRTVMAATAASVNGAYISMALQLDLCDTKKIAERLGVHTAVSKDDPDTTLIDNEIQSNPSSVLGTNDISPLTLAAAYAGVANNGVFCKPIAVDKVVDSHGKELPGQQPDCSMAVDPEVDAAAQYALAGAMNGYVANPRDGVPHIGKTGTTNDSKQTWVVSSSTKVTTVVWVGNIKGTFPIRKVKGGGNIRHLISKTIMLAADKTYGGGSFPSPPQRLLTGAGVAVDDVIGQTPELASSIIIARGLMYADGGPVDSDLPIGEVAKTDPAAGTILARGMTVTGYTSNGAMSSVPDVVTGHPNYGGPGGAKATLNAAGFNNVTQGCAVVPLGDPNIGKVVATDPAPGAIYLRTNAVIVKVGQVAACPP